MLILTLLDKIAVRWRRNRVCVTRGHVAVVNIENVTSCEILVLVYWCFLTVSSGVIGQKTGCFILTNRNSVV